MYIIVNKRTKKLYMGMNGNTVWYSKGAATASFNMLERVKFNEQNEWEHVNVVKVLVDAGIIE